MDPHNLHRAIVGVVGLAIGAALVTLIRIAAVDSAEGARLRHLADIAAGRQATPQVVLRGEFDCPPVALLQTANGD